MPLFILIIVFLFLICKPSKKKRRNDTNKQHTSQGKTPKKYKDMIRAERNMDRLAPDGELPVGWVTVYEDFIEEAEKEVRYFYNEYYEHRYGEPLKKYAALKSLLLYFEDAKKLYAKKGECFLFWFENWWAKPEEIQRLTIELRYLEEHFDELEEEYKRKQYVENILMPDIKKKVVKIIKENPGILQTDVYGHFDTEVKKHVQDALYRLNKDGKIKREKHGRTYKLTI